MTATYHLFHPRSGSKEAYGTWCDTTAKKREHVVAVVPLDDFHTLDHDHGEICTPCVVAHDKWVREARVELEAKKLRRRRADAFARISEDVFADEYQRLNDAYAELDAAVEALVDRELANEEAGDE